jgi:hypothetical protein
MEQVPLTDLEKQLDDIGFVKKTDEKNNDKLKKELNLP